MRGVIAFGGQEVRKALAEHRRFLELPDGIPSHDTFGRVFARLDPEAFEGPRFNRIAHIQQLLADRRLGRDLRWVG